MNKTEAVETLNKNAPEWIAQILKDDGNGFGEEIIDFNPMPEESNNWLWDEENQEYSGQIMDDSNNVYEFKIMKDGEDWKTSTKMVVDSETGEEPKEEDDDEVEMNEEPKEVEGGSVQPVDEVKNVDPKTEPEAGVVQPVEMGEKDKSKQDKDGRCWDGYEAVPGKKPFEKGSCRPKTEMSEVDVMKQELNKLRKEMAEYKEAQNQLKRDELAQFCECLYDDGRLTEGMMPKESVKLILEGVFNASIGEPMVYNENGNDVSILDGIKKLMSSLPKNIEFNEAIARQVDAPLLEDVPAIYGNVSEASKKEYGKIRKYQKDNNISTFLEAKRRMYYEM